MRHQFIRRAAALVLALVLAIPLTAPVRAADDVPLKITSDRADPLNVKETATLTLKAVWNEKEKPAGEIKYTWDFASNENITVVDAGAKDDEQKLTATGLKPTGTAKVTVTATWKDDKGEHTQKADYVLEVSDITLTIAGSKRWGKDPSDADKTYSVRLDGIELGDEDPEITWSAATTSAQPGVVVPTFSVTGAKDITDKETGAIIGSMATAGTAVKLKERTPGDFSITAEYTYDNITYSNTINMSISGIVLSGPGVTTVINKDTQKAEKSLNMVVNGSAALSVYAYGSARPTSGTVNVDWSSSDAAVVSVMLKVGSLNAWRIGDAVITVTTIDGDYSAYCTVTVNEDTSVIASGFTASASEPLVFWVEDPRAPNRDIIGLYTKLNDICKEKTAEHGEYIDPNAESPVGFGLDYITNLKVSPDQGTLYYNYSTESDTGDGVAATDQFAQKASGSKRGFDRLYFVPKPGVSGTVDITFTAIAENRRNIAGVIRVEVGSGSGAYEISYRTQAGKPAYFQAGDFEAWCLSAYGRTYNYIIFNLPKASEGVLYYNYIANSGNPVTTDFRFTPSGRYTLDDVCFVPNAAYQGESVTIHFRGVDTSGKAIWGEVKVNVIQPSTSGDSANVNLVGERGQPVVFQNKLFNDACQLTLKDTLNFVTFKLPDPTEGTLYVNYRGDGDYDSRVTAGTRCYYSGTPGLSSISFVPATGAAGLVAISYTGYGVGGASFSGTLYISLEEENRTTIYYSAVKGGFVTFRAADFYNAGLYTKGVGLTYVKFKDTSNGYYYFDYGSLGGLYYNYRSSSNYGWVYPGSDYYYNPNSSWYQRLSLSLISFRAGDTAGTVRIPYTAYDSSYRELFDGVVVIQVGSPTPDDVNLSCKTGEYTSAWQLGAQINSVCSAVMNGNLSYIEITSVPSEKKGHLYYNYSGFGTGKVVEPGDRFNYLGSRSLYQLTFIPFARFSGQAEITYIGYSGDGKELVSGRILVNVSKTKATEYFNDMDSATWAIDAVEYLYRNDKIVKGVGGGRFNPDGIVTKGDFTLMLVRAYKLTAAGSAFYNDVPAGSYYADAIRIATLLGIVSGSNGNFNPKVPLTRQEAVVMLYKTLKISGKAATNGLAADLSAYRDEGAIGADAREAMGILVYMSVVKGDNGYLRPQGQLSRAEAAVLLHAMMTL